MISARLSRFSPLVHLGLIAVLLCHAAAAVAEPTAEDAPDEEASEAPVVAPNPLTSRPLRLLDPRGGARPPAQIDARHAADSGPKSVVSFSFREAAWEDVLHQFAEWAGLTLDLTDVPEGTFNYYDEAEYTIAEALDVLNGYLLPRGHVLLRRDGFLVALKTDNKMLSNLIPTVPLAELADRGEGELVRIVLPLEGIDPEQAAKEIEQVLGPHGKAAALAVSRSLVVEGFGRNLRDVVATLSDAVVPPGDDDLVFRSFPLKNISAKDAERHVRSLFGLDAGAVNVSRGRYEIERRIHSLQPRSDRRNNQNQRQERPTEPPQLLAKLAANMRVAAATRTNSLLVTAPPTGAALVEELLTTIDVPQEGSAGANAWDRQEEEPVLRVYHVQEATEQEVANTLDVVMPGVVVNEDRRKGSIHILATPEQHREIASLIQTLDGSNNERVVEVFLLRKFDPSAMSALLGGLFENESRGKRPVIQAERQTRTLVVRGTVAQVDEIRQTLRAYGELGEPGGRFLQGGRFRRLGVGGRNAEGIARVVEQVLAEDGEFENGIRVVVPGEPRGLPSGRSREEAGRPIDDAPGPREEESAPRGIGGRTGLEAAGARVVPARFLLEEAAPDAEPPAGRERSEERPRRGEGRGGSRPDAPPRVHIEVRGGELFLYSSDEAALDEVESIIQDLMRQMPDRTKWTVFYLRAADAEAMAERLLDLVPEIEEAGALAGEVGGTAPLPLRIVPDERTNALFVSGPDEQVSQIEGFLDYLDRTELPVLARDRVPRSIPVRYADAEAVAEMLRELYKDYLEDPAERLRQQDQRNRRSSRRPPEDAGRGPGVRLTLAVDPQTSDLLVSCNDRLFQEIKDLVERRDQAARDARPTLRVVNLREASPAHVGETLESLFPKVTTHERPQSQGRSSRAPRSSSDRRRR